MIDMNKAVSKLIDTVTEWAGERPDEYKAAGDVIRKNRLTGACDMANKRLNYHDEYYTSREQIEYMVNLYDPEVFYGKYVYCNCDAPWSNIYKYFKDNFSRLKLRHLTATAIPDDNREWRGTRTDYDGETERVTQMEWSGSFDSAESKKILSECDMCVTNPPFSLIRPYMELVLGSGKEFITFMSAMNITYHDILDAYIQGRFYIIMARDKFARANSKLMFDKHVNYLVVSNIAGSREIEITHTKKPKYVRYDPNVHREPDNAPGCLNLDTIADGIPVYGGKIYVPISIVMNLYWDRDNFDVLPEDLDVVVDGKNKFRRLPIILKNKNLQPIDN